MNDDDQRPIDDGGIKELNINPESSPPSPDSGGVLEKGIPPASSTPSPGGAGEAGGTD